ncbi:hypothetical protein KSS87_019033 [Heliosperma pusillum]|nr:hypothetical protein KSS87_019033 [Heliosperma pusillum]
MNGNTGENCDNVGSVPTMTRRNKFARGFQHHLDRSAPHLLRRWLATLGLAMVYGLRVYWVKGFHVVSYGLATYVLNLLIGFLSPKVDPELEGIDGLSSPGRESDEYKPFERRLPEFRLCFKAYITVDPAENRKGVALTDGGKPSRVLHQVILTCTEYQLNFAPGAGHLSYAMELGRK